MEYFDYAKTVEFALNNFPKGTELQAWKTLDVVVNGVEYKVCLTWHEIEKLVQGKSITLAMHSDEKDKNYGVYF